jgi:hypothetical protein
MKICPRCQKTYADDNLNFCLEDGAVLTQASAQPPPPTSPIAPFPTQPQPSMPGQPSSQQGWNVPQTSSQPKRSSKAWVWVLLILGVLILVCGGGFVAFLAFVSSRADNAANGTSNDRTSNSNWNKAANLTSNSSTSSTSTSNSSRTDVDTIDLSPWVKDFSAYGNTSFTGGEFIMSSKQKNFYYVLVATEDYDTDDADTRVTLRNVDNAGGNLGYGLIFHSDPTPLQQDYAFLIDTKRKKYRVVHHTPQKENSVIGWTSSDAINAGAAENTIEVRDMPDKIELYINGKMVNSIKNVYGYAGGVPGLYAGDGVKIAFKDLQVRK